MASRSSTPIGGGAAPLTLMGLRPRFSSIVSTRPFPRHEGGEPANDFPDTPMDRRSFFSRLGGGVSGSFLLWSLGGLGAGTAGAVGIEAARPWSRSSHSQQGEDLIVDTICD